MVVLYHGSNVEVATPKVELGRSNLDFGRAFYLTDIPAQAEQWAKIMYSRKETGLPTISRYELDDEAVIKKGYRKPSFTEYNLEWLDFVVENRHGGTAWKAYDIVEGGIANDRVIETVEAYMDGEITGEQALGKLKFCKPNNQIAIINQSIIDEHLRFVGSYTL